MIRTSIARLIATGGAVCALAMAAAGQAAAADWPWHSVAGAWCTTVYGHHYIQGNMPAVQSRPETLSSISGGSFQIGDYSGVSNGGTATPAYDEWIYYRLAIGHYDSTGRLLWDHSNWDAVLNIYQGGGMIYEFLDNHWQQVNIGAWGGGTRTPGTQLEVAEGGDYVIYGEYWWGPFSTYSQLGPLYEPIGVIHCSAG